MPTRNEIPGVSLIDRLQAENKKLKEENTELQKSVGKLQLFNKILEREVTELKTPSEDTGSQQQESFVKQELFQLPVKKIATFAIIGLLILASIYAIASLFGNSKPSVTQASSTVVPPPAKKETVAMPVANPQSKRLSMQAIDTNRRRLALMEDNTPYDSVTADDLSLGHYKVKSRAYFHKKPSEDTKIDLYINPVTKSTLEALDDKNGFVFVVFKNEAGKVTRGWLRKLDLKQVSASSRY